MARPRPLPSFGDLPAYATQGPMTRRERRAWYRQLCADFRRHDKALEKARQEGTVMKLDVLEVVKDPRGKDYAAMPGQSDGPPKIQDLIFMAMGDESGPGPGMPAPIVDEAEKRQRWRISVEVFATNGEPWECTRDDLNYIVKRAAVMLASFPFGFLDGRITETLAAEPVPMPEPPAE